MFLFHLAPSAILFNGVTIVSVTCVRIIRVFWLFRVRIREDPVYIENKYIHT